MANYQNPTVDNASKKASNGISRAGEMAEDALSQVSDKASQYSKDISEKASELGEKASKFTESVRDHLPTMSSVSDRMSSIAETIRDKAPEGSIGSAAVAVADSLDSSGRYLADHSLSDVTKDVTQVVRKYPVQSLCIGLGVGLLIGSVLSGRK